MRYAINFDVPETEATIFMEDGGIVTIYHNGEYILTTLYQERVELFNNEMWEALDDGKVYVQSWENKQTIDNEIIKHAIDWLCPMCDSFQEVEFFNLVSEFNYNKTK